MTSAGIHGSKSAASGGVSPALLVGAGIASALIGLLMLTNLLRGLYALSYLVGTFLLLWGIADLAGIVPIPNRTWQVILGASGIVAGLVAFFLPSVALSWIVDFVGFALIVWGLIHVIAAFAQSAPHKSLQVLIGALDIIVGVVAFTRPGATAIVLVIFVGVDALVTGVLQIVTALRTRSAGHV